MKKYKAVVFDLFTTLTSLRHLPDAPGRSSNEVLGIDARAWADAIFNRSRERLTGVINDPVEIIRDVAHKVDPGISDEILEECAAERQIRFDYCLENPPAGVVESVAALKEAGYKICLCSNADSVEIKAWDNSPLAPLFDEVVFSCFVGHMKPDPEIFTICCERMGVEPADCLYVGDGGNSELIASAQAGMTAVLTSQFLMAFDPELVAKRAATVNHHIGNLDEIPALLKRLES